MIKRLTHDRTMLLLLSNRKQRRKCDPYLLSHAMMIQRVDAADQYDGENEPKQYHQDD